jgi:hypothetical protein
MHLRRFILGAGALCIASTAAFSLHRPDGAATAQLSPYRERAHTVANYVRRLPANEPTWTAVFRAPGSPFRAATHLHYLRVRYGLVAGTLLAAGRIAGWHAAFIAAATGAGRGSATDR